MTTLTFYGGVLEIGGNKILLEDGEHRFFLDFGFPYKTHKLFYEEYLKPRAGACLLDPLEMGLLPPLEGLYRDDLALPGLWSSEGRFHQHPLYRKLEEVDGVLLSHAHLDHSGHIAFLKEDIPVFSTAATAFIAKAIQDSGKADFDQQVCYFSPRVQNCPAGLKQVASLSENSEKKQRQFLIADMKAESLSLNARKFWSSTGGFWEKSQRQKELLSLPLVSHDGTGSGLRCFPVDHSIQGGCAWGIETSSGWVIYSGDLRLHGKRARVTEAFIEKAASLHPRALIMEGTNVDSSSNISEQEVFEKALKAIRASDKLVIADFSPRDMDRLLTFLHIARNTGRKLAILPRDAYLLKTMRLLNKEIPELAEEDSIVIYQKTTADRSPDLWLRNLYQDYDRKVILARDVASNQDQFILCFSFFDLNELPGIQPLPGSLYVYSSSEAHSEEQEIDFRRMHNWLEHFKMKIAGLPVEIDGKWQIPENERGLHASGHAYGPDLLRIVQDIGPELLIPVHSEKPELYREKLSNTSIKVLLPSPGGTVQI